MARRRIRRRAPELDRFSIHRHDAAAWRLGQDDADGHLRDDRLQTSALTFELRREPLAPQRHRRPHTEAVQACNRFRAFLHLECRMSTSAPSTLPPS